MSVSHEIHCLSSEEAAAVRELDVNSLSELGAHPLLGFMARFNVEHDRRTERDPAGGQSA